MGSAASVAVPDAIHFQDLLRLAPVLVSSEDNSSIDIDALRNLFKRNRNSDGFISKDRFVQLVIEFSENAKLRESIVIHNDNLVEQEEEVRLQEITEIHRFRDAPLYNQVHLMDYEVFRSHGSYPCFTEPVTASLHHEDKLRFRFTTPADEIDFENAYVIFISHTWFKRGENGGLDPAHTNPTDTAVVTGNSQPAPSAVPSLGTSRSPQANDKPRETPVHVNTHPDTVHNEQYKLCVSGLNKFVDAHLTNFDKVYVWMDYSCLDLRPEHIEATLSKLSLTTIMACCDCIFTPVLDYDLSWEYPFEMNHFFEDFNPAPWCHGPAAYMNRAWCRMEMFYANNVPIMADLTPEDIAAYTTRYHSALVDKHHDQEGKKGVFPHLVDPNALLSDLHFVHRNPFANLSAAVLGGEARSKMGSRRMRMSKRLRARASSEQRPHVIYGSYEYRLGLPPLIVSPLANLYLDKYAPLAGHCSRADDITSRTVEVEPPSQTGSPHSPCDGLSPTSPARKGLGASAGISHSYSHSHSGNTSPVRAKGTPTAAAASPHPRRGNASPAIRLDVDYNKRASVKMCTAKVVPSVLQRLYDELVVLTNRVKVGYEGQVNEEGERHGRGVYTYANGEKYIGEWEHGKKHGTGYFLHHNGDSYDGEFYQDHPQGLCTLRYAASGDAYYGELHHGRRSGHGVLEYRNGDLYEGEFRHDVRSGEGVLRYATGEVYTGQFRHDKRHGFGTLVDRAGATVHQGMWKDDLFAPDFQPDEEGAEMTADGHEHQHHHKHHHKHHHHHKHRHHHHSHHDSEDHGGHGGGGEADQDPPVTQAQGDGDHHGHSPHTLPTSAEGHAVDVQRLKERLAQARELYTQKRLQKAKTAADIEHEHLQDAKSGKYTMAPKKALKAHAVEASMSAPDLPLLTEQAGHKEHPPKHKQQQQHTKKKP